MEKNDLQGTCGGMHNQDSSDDDSETDQLIPIAGKYLSMH